MAIDTVLRELNLDRYDRNARLRPALLVVLPALVLIALWLPKVWTFFGALTSLLVACGVTFLLAQLARERGRSLEKRWRGIIGREHTAILLSHANTALAAPTKHRYHAFLASKGLGLPTAAEERLNRAKAHELYRSAGEWLLEYTRPKAPTSLLLDENISYGFRRNLMGLKPVALSILALAVVGNALLTYLAGPVSTMFWPGIALEVGLLAAACAWIWMINKAFVVDASLAYAQRLLAQCDAAAP
jgi:hypothetical protein